jgi:peptidyl-prolyl cis-trans isomerase SurA
LEASLHGGLCSLPAILKNLQKVRGIAAWVTLALMVCIFGAGCKKTYGPDVAATVNGQPIQRAEVERYYRDNLGNAQQQPTQEQADATRLNILRQLIDDEILQERAAKLHLVATDEEVDAKLAEWKAPYTQEEFDQKLKSSNMSLDNLRKRIRVQLTQEKLLNKEIFSKIDITDADISNFYNANKAGFNFIEPKYHIAEIVVTTQPTKMQVGANLQNSKASNDTEARKKIEMLHSRLESGDDFANIAANYSENPNDASNGGDMGFIPESALHNDPAVYAAISKLKPGQMSDVVALTAPGSKTPSEYAIFKLLEREPAGQRQLNDPRVQQDIRQQLRDGRAQLLKAAYYEMLRDQAKIVNYLAEEIFKNGSH